MNTRARATAATLIGLAAVLGVSACQQTTEGTVAQTTEPGPPISSDDPTGGPGIPGLPDINIPNLPNLPLPTRGTDVPTVPAPPNALEMGCEEFSGLDEATRVAVVREILAQEGNPLGSDGEFIGQILADGACQFFPTAKVSDVLLGGGSPP